MRIEELKYLSNTEIIELLKGESIFPALIQEAILRGSDSINHLLNKMSKENKDIIDLYAFINDIPNKLEMIYYPNTDKFEETEFSNNIIINIPENKKRIFKSINDEESFCLKLKLEKVKDSLLEYQLVEKKDVMADVKNLASVAIVSAILSSSILFNNAVDTTKRNQESFSSIEFNNIISEELYSEYSKIKSKNIEDLTNQDIKLILSLKEEENNKNPLNQEFEKEEILSSIKDIISPYIKDQNKVYKIASSIYEASLERKVDYLLFLSIMKVETTTFNQDAVSSTGDISIAQIKPEIWREEFNRLGKDPLDEKRLKKDASYAIDRMGEILELQHKHKYKDPYWYARYHSNTPKRKIQYAKKVQSEYMKLKHTQIVKVKEKIDLIIKDIDNYRSKDESVYSKFFVDTDKLLKLKEKLTEYNQSIADNKNSKLKKILAKL